MSDSRLNLLAAVLFFVAGAAPDRAVAEGVVAKDALFGLVVGTNRSDSLEVPPLKYADDDAVENAALLTQLGARVALLTKLDSATKKLYGDVSATPPTKKSIQEAMRVLNSAMDKARAQGLRPVLYLLFSGHGDVENNEGYLVIEDGRLVQSELIDLIRSSKAAINHLVIDACKSFFMVYGRGTGGRRAPIRSPLGVKADGLPSNTGVMLSTSSAADSHEWEAYQGGVFSHELRSGLRGAADLDLNGVVTYEEAAAFIWTANSDIRNERFRPDFFSRPPSGQASDKAILARVDRATGDRLLIGPEEHARFYVEDGLGRRLADLHPATSQRTVLLLVNERPLFIRQSESSEEMEIPAGESVSLAALTPRPSSTLRRGAEHNAFRHLFARAFDKNALDNYRKRPLEELSDDAPSDDLSWLRYSFGIASLGVAVAGGVMTGLAVREHDLVKEKTSMLGRKQANDRIDVYNAVAVTCYVLSGAMAATFLAWTLWPSEKVNIKILPSVGPSLALTGEFR
jgi:hypothetical protein